jgi:hypothetical protein
MLRPAGTPTTTHPTSQDSPPRRLNIVLLVTQRSEHDMIKRLDDTDVDWLNVYTDGQRVGAATELRST